MITLDELFARAQELGNNLRETEEFKNAQRAEIEAMNKPETAMLLTEFIEKRTQLQRMMGQDNPDPMAMKKVSDEMDDAQERLNLLDDIIEMGKARSAFEDLFGQVISRIEAAINGRDGSEGGCSGNCANCSGCH